MPLAIVFTDFGDGRDGGVATATLSDTMVLPVSSNACLYLLMTNEHRSAGVGASVTLTGETVTTGRAFDNPAADSSVVNFGFYAVRNPGSGTKTLTVTDSGNLRSFAWCGWLVTGVPTSAFTDDIQATTGSTTNSLTQSTGTITTTKPDGLILSMWGWRGGDRGPFALTNGWVEDVDDTTGASTSTDTSYVAAHRVTTTAGAYTSTATATGTNRPGVISVSVLASVSRRRSQVIIT